MPYVYSTITADTNYCEYHKSPEGAASARLKRSVTINGGANLAPVNRHLSSVVLMTPRGAVTQVTDEELDFLENNEAFKRHRARNFLAVESKAKDINVVVSAGMAPQDESAPITPKSKEVLGTAIPVVNTKK